MLTAVPKSAVPGVSWPAVPETGAANLLAVQYQLEHSQWWPEALLRERQFVQLNELVAHAFRTVPFYRERLTVAGYHEGERLTPELWAALPVLRRSEVQDAGAELNSRDLPRGHGQAFEVATSGSTGAPVKVLRTELNNVFWFACMLRERLWQRLDGSKKFCAIRGLGPLLGPEDDERAAYPHGLALEEWGDTYGYVFPTSPSALLPVRTDIPFQVEWLQRQRPYYLLTFTSNARSLAEHCLEHDIPLPELERVLTFGEVLTPEIRAACRAAWSALVLDTYSTVEAGYIASQCTDYEHYHVQAEDILVEVLDQGERPCRPGEVGQVVVTPLHSFATPLLRYALGDHAEVGAPCPCGRGLPVLTRILGRTRDVLRLPSGATMHPWDLYAGQPLQGMPIRQFQIVQTGLEQLELRLVAKRPLVAAEEEIIRRRLIGRLGHPFAIAFIYCDEIPRTAAGKYEDFRSELAD